MKTKSENKKGGKGKAFEIRNRMIVALRRKDEKLYTYEVLGDIFGINRTTVEDIYKRDSKKFVGSKKK